MTDLTKTTSTTSTLPTTVMPSKAIGGTLWNVNDRNELIINHNRYLQTELGVALRAKQDANLIQSIKDPEKFIGLRSEKIASLFGEGGAVTIAFKTRYAELQALFIPEELARSMAKKAALRVYNDELELLELEAPDAYTKAFGIASVEHNAMLAKNDVAGTGLNEFDFITKYKSYKNSMREANNK